MPNNPTNTPTVRLSRTIRTVVIASKAWQRLLTQNFVRAYLALSSPALAIRFASLDSRQTVNFWQNFLLRFWRLPGNCYIKWAFWPFGLRAVTIIFKD